jgi:hypothetical protein
MRISIAIVGATAMFWAAPLVLATAFAASGPDITISKTTYGAPDTATISRVREIVANTKDASGVFVVQDDGTVHHIQSGLNCPAEFPNADFRHAEIFPSALGAGMDVDCDYGRSDANEITVSKLTIFATKASDGASLDQAFDKYRTEIRKAFPDVHPTGPALGVERKDNAAPSIAAPALVAVPNENAMPLFADFRSEAYDLLIDGAPYHSELIVALQGGWVIEIRSTYSTHISATSTPDEMGRSVMDAAGPSLAFIAASASVAK